MDKWSIDKARAVYNIGNWSDGFFDINESGQLVYCDQGQKQTDQKQSKKTNKLSFPELVQAIRDEGLQLPVLARFPGILRDRLRYLIAAFDQARESLDYAGKYTAIYPVKVNQQRSVVESLLKAGGDRLGLEAGSKPELLAILSTMTPGGVIVCNGYKDREFIELAMAGIAIGFRVFVVIEKLTELDLLIEVAREVGLKPNIGLRIRLATVGSGNWQNSGGDKSKFGLAASEVLLAITKMKSAQFEDCLDMIHFHMGSQIANLDDITQGLQEAAQFYVQCCALTRPVSVINVGGGLGVDYEGTRSRSYFSKNYSSKDYARTITAAIKEACTQHYLPEPEIYSESGRSLTAHHAVLITNVLEVEQPPRFQPENLPAAKNSELPVALGKLLDLSQSLPGAIPETLSDKALSENYHQAGKYLTELQTDFSQASCPLHFRAAGESIYVSICIAIREKLDPANRVHREILDQLNEKLVDKYFCNFSVFQSVPDIWAMQQVFPIMPVQGLNVEPTRRGVVVDITCDSDGRIDHYVDNEGVEASLPLHEVGKNQDYLIAIFLVGAYQEILGDMHNLFGDTNSVNVSVTGENEIKLSEIDRGDTVSSVLEYVHYDQAVLAAALEQKIEAVSHLQDSIKQSLLATIKRGLTAYTYLKS